MFKFLLALLFLSQAHAATMCDEGNVKRLTSAVDGAYNSVEELLEQTIPKSKLHIFGEAHFHTSLNLIGSAIENFDRLMAGSKKCLFLELPKGGIDMLKEYLRILPTRDELSEVEKKRLESYFKYHLFMANKAEELGMQVFEIDHPKHFETEQSEDDRNIAMTENALKHLSNSCEGAIFFVGKAHISPLENRASIVDLLKKKDFRPITYNLEDYGEKLEIETASWAGIGCTVREFSPVAFSNSILLPNTRMFPNWIFLRQPLWNDFDYSIRNN